MGKIQSPEDHFTRKRASALPKSQKPSPNDQENGQNKKSSRSFKTTNETQKAHWNSIEQRRYINFLIKCEKLFSASFDVKKRKRIYVMMGKEVIVRNSDQCRSHHQKMMAKFGSIQNIISAHQHLLENRLNLRKTEQQQDAPQKNAEVEETYSETESSPPFISTYLPRYYLEQEDLFSLREEQEEVNGIDKYVNFEAIKSSLFPSIAVPDAANGKTCQWIYFIHGEVFVIKFNLEDKIQQTSQ